MSLALLNRRRCLSPAQRQPISKGGPALVPSQLGTAHINSLACQSNPAAFGAHPPSLNKTAISYYLRYKLCNAPAPISSNLPLLFHRPTELAAVDILGPLDHDHVASY